MRALTSAERRGVLLVAGLFLLGAAYDVWRAARPTVRGLVVARVETAEVPVDRPGAAAERPESTRPAPAASGPMDLNRATPSDLETLDGIGPTLARRIVEHRVAHGPFRSVDELLAVRGIGPRLMERIRPHVAVSTVPG